MADRPGKGSISATPDDPGGRRRPAGAPRRRSGGEGRRGARVFGNAVLVVLIGGLAAAGWFLAEQYQRLQAQSDVLAKAQSRISTLEDRLKTSDQAFTQRGQSTTEKLDLWESEIRKLWAVSNERNKKWIQDNQKAIDSLKSSVDKLQSTNRDIQSTLGRHESAFARQQDLVDQLNSIQMELQQVSRSQRDLVDRVNTAQQTVAKLQSGLEGRVKDNEQAVAAFDAYRLQLNSRLADIERRLKDLSSSATL